MEGACRLDTAPWMMAWDCYALAAEVLKQMTFNSAMAHKAAVMEISCNARAEGRQALLAMMYDELARWELAAMPCVAYAFFLCKGRSGRTWLGSLVLAFLWKKSLAR